MCLYGVLCCIPFNNNLRVEDICKDKICAYMVLFTVDMQHDYFQK